MYNNVKNNSLKLIYQPKLINFKLLLLTFNVGLDLILFLRLKNIEFEV